MKHSILYFLFFLLISCNKDQKTSDTFAFIGATFIDGTGSDAIPEGVMIVSGGRIKAIGKRSEVEIPSDAELVDVTGKFIMPGIINAHGHVGDVKGIEGGHYSKENVAENLSIYARYGVTTVVSLGGDKAEAETFRAVNDSTSTQRARLFICGEVITGKTPDEAIAIVDANDKMGVDWMKVRIDDNLGTAEKIHEAVYRAAILHASDLNYKTAAHIYYLEDARKAVDAGAAMIAHSVRDKVVDQEFIDLMREHQVRYCPTLTREMVNFVYGDTAEFFSDPFFQREYDQAMIQPLLDPVRQLQVRNSKSAITYKQQLPTAMANLKILSDNGVIIVFGTDSGVPTRFMGYFEHLEMAIMADAGLTPMQIIKSATKDAADAMGLWRLGLGGLEVGNRADFIVLDADPLMDIKNSRKIDRVFIGGEMVTRKR